MRILHCTSTLLLLLQGHFIPPARANTEKTIFVAPPSITIPNVHPGLDDLCIDNLTPANSIVQAQLPVAFPNKTAPRGRESWYLLDRLRAGQRYEVRVCWVATVRLASVVLYLCMIALHIVPTQPTLPPIRLFQLTMHSNPPSSGSTHSLYRRSSRHRASSQA